MAEPTRTQKQIAERYKGNLAYYKRLHPWRAARIAVSFVALVGGLLAVLYYHRHANPEFFNPGAISSGHALIAQDCAKCHQPKLAPRELLDPYKLGFALGQQFNLRTTVALIDGKCANCHADRDFHAPTVVANRSCSACHQEHRGPEAISLASDRDCAACHNDRKVMQASAALGRQLPASAFPPPRNLAQRAALQLPRPPDGQTQVFARFDGAHPDFRWEQNQARDPDTLRFNHQRHFAADIPLSHGRRLECASCHQPEPDGRYLRRISFEANCRSCHALQFDPRNPELTLPHGDPAAVRGFLRTLPGQYEALAVSKGLTSPAQRERFVAAQLTQLRERVRSGEDFERQIFFTSDPYRQVEGSAPPIGSVFHGCAFCHEVKPAAHGAPLVTKPILVDRWLLHGQFNHAKHQSVGCNDCHHATASRETADVLLPAKASCVACHSPAGKVASNCTTCHDYHHAPISAAK